VAERALARIDLGAVERNCARLLSELDEQAELCAVVKADGYGHGAQGCAGAALAGGATRLAVATAAEAAEIATAFEGVPLLTMGALTPEELDMALQAGSDVARDGGALPRLRRGPRPGAGWGLDPLRHRR
jgi:alanine racemase